MFLPNRNDARPFVVKFLKVPFKEKDKLEARLCKQIKAHKLDPQEAFDRMTKDGVKFYIEEITGEDELKDQLGDDEGQEGR